MITKANLILSDISNHAEATQVNQKINTAPRLPLHQVTQPSSLLPMNIFLNIHFRGKYQPKMSQVFSMIISSLRPITNQTK